MSDAELEKELRQTIERFFAAVSRRDMAVLAEFADSDDVLLAGSDAGEIARGRAELRAFFQRLFSREVTFSWRGARVDAVRAVNLAWLFAEGEIVMDGPQGHKAGPYCISGVLEKLGGHWRWRQYHGCEPVPEA